MVLPFSLLLLLLLLFFPVQEEVHKERREMMVKHTIEKRGISDRGVLNAMRTVRRHMFVPPELADRAYEDNPLPIGSGQTISQPYIVAYMTQVLRPTPRMKVLEIGTGFGYQAAVLAEIVREVYTIEIIPELGQSAAERLKKLGYDNVHVKVSDGYQGWPEQAPFDAIIVTAAAETIPPPLIEQLKEGGRMVIPVGSPSKTQILTLVEKKKGKTVTKSLLPVVFVPFTGGDQN
ncbi:protein-L-isoaspartate(D-aspartate) O-methyltransferase [Pontibacter toksunensis]|uniref:Protein-L-isoaspartate O-methyltransferase n=1 Tax=Pontibacter toksunensis TaxID=1332631 RepID=A0ABW6BMG5_9BACT